MEGNRYDDKLLNKTTNIYTKRSVIFFMIFIQFISLIGGVKADFGETIATIIFYLLVTVFICAGIGWWQHRQEGSAESEK